MTNESFIKVNNKLVLVNGHPITINDIDNGSSINLQENKAVTITSNGTVSVAPDAPYDALKKVDVTVNVASGGDCGGTPAPANWKDVTFIDYDRSVLYSYSLTEAQALTELPSLPSHDGLVCQGWNWTLEEIKALNRPVSVGAMYITDNGATRLHIRIATVGRMTVPLFINQSMANGVSIDWGDGSTAETLADTGNVNTSHTYAEPGNYIISLMPQDGCTLSFGNGSTSYCVIGSTENWGKVYCNMLQDVFIGKNVASISNSAFYNCYSLASITIPNSVISINSRAFQNCYSLANITIPDGVTSIDSYTFYDCYSLASITIPNSVASISNSAFSDCYSLVNITIPDSVTSIDSYTFSNCRSLANIIIPDSVTSIDSYAFSNCHSLASIIIPNGVTVISNSAFSNCYSLANIIIPNGVTSIDSNAFYSCYSLANITIPNGVTSIGSDAFDDCYSLASITIPDSVTFIGSYAFFNCYGMRYYDFSACTSIPALSSTTVFNNIPSDCQMLIPSSLYNSWKSATNWTTYASQMVAV